MRQQVEEDLKHGQARQQQVAELPSLRPGPRAIQRRPEERPMSRKQRLQFGKLVSAVSILRIAARHLLEAQHVAVAHRLGHRAMRARSKRPSHPRPHWMFQVRIEVIAPT